MQKVSEERMKLRLDYSRETDLIFSDNIPLYADWLESRLTSKNTIINIPKDVKRCIYGTDYDEKKMCSRCGNYHF